MQVLTHDYTRIYALPLLQLNINKDTLLSFCFFSHPFLSHPFRFSTECFRKSQYQVYIEFSGYLPLAYANKRSLRPNYEITIEIVIMKFSSIGLLLAGVAGVANVKFTSFKSLVYFSVLRRTNLRYNTLRFLVTPSSVLVINAVSKVENV